MTDDKRRAGLQLNEKATAAFKAMPIAYTAMGETEVFNPPQPEPAKEPGQVAYEATYPGGLRWEFLNPSDHRRWAAAERAVLEAAGVERNDVLRTRIRYLEEAMQVGSEANGELIRLQEKAKRERDEQKARADRAVAKRASDIEDHQKDTAELIAEHGNQLRTVETTLRARITQLENVARASQALVGAWERCDKLGPFCDGLKATLKGIDTTPKAEPVATQGDAAKPELPGGYGPTKALEQSVVELARAVDLLACGGPAEASKAELLAWVILERHGVKA